MVKTKSEKIEEALESESWEYAYSKLMQLGLDEETVYEMLDEYFDFDEEE